MTTWGGVRGWFEDDGGVDDASRGMMDDEMMMMMMTTTTTTVKLTSEDEARTNATRTRTRWTIAAARTTWMTMRTRRRESDVWDREDARAFEAAGRLDAAARRRG